VQKPLERPWPFRLTPLTEGKQSMSCLEKSPLRLGGEQGRQEDSQGLFLKGEDGRKARRKQSLPCPKAADNDRGRQEGLIESVGVHAPVPGSEEVMVKQRDTPSQRLECPKTSGCRAGVTYP
jgi:hypothetical protein